MKKTTISYKESQKHKPLFTYSKKKKIVFTNGCFDILHPGHIKLLREAKSLGDKLVVGMNSDKSIKHIELIKTNKGKEGRPINNEKDRKAVLEGIKYVDEVIIFDEPTPLELIKKVKPDVLVKGADYKPDEICGSNLVKKVVRVPLTGHSTTKIIEKIRIIK